MGYLKRRDADQWLVHLPELAHFLGLKIPYFDLTRLVAKDYFDFIWVKDCTVDHDSAIVALPLEAETLEVKDVDRAVFTGNEEPLILSLELHGHSIPSETIERHLLSMIVVLRQVIDLNKAIRKSP